MTAKGVRGIIAYAVARGADREDVLDETGIDAGVLADPDGRIDRSEMLALWRAIARRLGDPAIALAVSRALPFGAYDVLDYAFATSPTVRDGMDVVRRYLRLFVDDAEMVLEERGDVTVLGYRLLHDDGGLERFSSEFAFALLLDRIRHTADVADPAPAWVEFAHECHGPPSAYEAYFQAPVRFGAADNRLAFPARVAGASMNQGDAGLNTVLQRHAGNLMAQLPEAVGLEAEVRRELYASIDRGASSPTIDDVGGSLGLGARTLQRRLAEQGTTFAQLLDDTRYDLAARFLGDEALTIGEVGFMLGFSEPSAFHRAFRRWSGSTPGEFRKNLRR